MIKPALTVKRVSITAAVGLLSLTTYLFKYNSTLAGEQSLLSQPWKLSGSNGAAEASISVDPNILKGKNQIKITYNLHGLCALQGDASAVIFDQNGWKYVALSNYGENCKDGEQTISVPLSDFKDINTGEVLNPNLNLTGRFQTRFWYFDNFSVDILSAVLVDSSNSTGSGLPAPTGTPGGTSAGNISTKFTGISPEQVVTGAIKLGYEANQSETARVAFFVDDSLRSIERYYPYFLGGDNNNVPNGWDTKRLADGAHTIRVDVVRRNGSRYSDQIRFIANNNGTVKPTTSPTSLPSATAIPSSPAPTTTAAPVVTPSPAPTKTPAPVTGKSWEIQSVDAMKVTKDVICGQKDEAWINKWMDKAVEVGANYVAISTPYENPPCGDARAYTKLWIKSIRAHGLKVWHRQMPLAFEGIYDRAKATTGDDFLGVIANYIKQNPDNYQAGDIFTPIPEPQNGGISGITYCAAGVCQFNNPADFNAWLRNAIDTSEQAFSSIGKGGQMKLGYYGFDGFVAWGANNPDWNGILEDATIAKMGNITVDHYPELIGTSMKTDLDELQARYPNTPIIIGEWGTAVSANNLEQDVINSMGASKRSGVVGFNYWQFGPDGAGEPLINGDFTNRVQFDEVQSYFKGLR